MNNNVIKFLAVFCVGAGVGIFSYTTTALEYKWLYTDSDLEWSLAQQQIQDVADVCSAIGIREWAEDDRSFKRLRGWGNTRLRASYAVEILTEMKVEPSLIDQIDAECATRLSES